MDYWTRLKQFIKEFEEHGYMRNSEEDSEFFETWELEMAKAFLHDCPEAAVRVSKVILAIKDINDIKIKIR